MAATRTGLDLGPDATHIASIKRNANILALRS